MVDRLEPSEDFSESGEGRPQPIGIKADAFFRHGVGGGRQGYPVPAKKKKGGMSGEGGGRALEKAGPRKVGPFN